jgi:hypothetical protein
MNMKCDCGRDLQTENDIKRGFCFGCHVKSVRLGFTYGKDNFHGPTIREQQRYYEDSQAFKDGKITKVPDRAELI